MSPSLTSPASLPSAPHTGTALTRLFASRAAISATLVSGATMMAGDDITSAAVVGMAVLSGCWRMMRMAWNSGR